MFSPFTANGSATDALRIACRHAAEQQARPTRHAGHAGPARMAHSRRAATTVVLGGWLVALLGQTDASALRG